jgi:hypothetical protein
MVAAIERSDRNDCAEGPDDGTDNAPTTTWLPVAGLAC